MLYVGKPILYSLLVSNFFNYFIFFSYKIKIKIASFDEAFLFNININKYYYILENIQVKSNIILDSNISH